MAKDHDKETLHPPPKNEGSERLAVSAVDDQNLDTKRIEFDFKKYAKFLDNSDLSEAQKLELLSAVWRIMSEFVLLGWGVHPIQQACGQERYQDANSTMGQINLLSSNHTQIIAEIERLADLEDDLQEEGVEV